MKIDKERLKVITISVLNNIPMSEFVEKLEAIFEHSPWVAQKAGEFRPFESLDSLYEKMIYIVQTASLEEKINLIQSHPQLGTRKTMGSFSKTEQRNAGLGQLSETEYKHLLDMNKQYTARFGFPFILAVRGKNKEDILQTMQERLKNSRDDEFNQALTEIYKIARFRLEDQING